MSPDRTRSRPRCAVALACAALLLAPAIARAELLSKTYEFRDGVTLEIGVETENGVRLDSIRFELPARDGNRILRTGGLVQAEVAISNIGDAKRRIGVAIALFDGSGNLVGVASGGNRVLPLKRERQQTFKLAFDDVNGSAHRAATFQISIETEP